MSKFPDALWVNVSPSLRRFDLPLVNLLSKEISLGEWEYRQTSDEPTSPTIAMALLHDYLKICDRPLHLLAHGMGGLVIWLYAHRYPERVRSLTLLSVGVNPAIDWQAYYYNQLGRLPYFRKTVLMQVVQALFDCHCRGTAIKFQQALERDLLTSLSPHSLYKQVDFFPARVAAPLLVCGGDKDVVIDGDLLEGWQPWLKDCDRLRLCAEGNHFFHYFAPEVVREQIVDFWSSIEFFAPFVTQPACRSLETPIN